MAILDQHGRPITIRRKQVRQRIRASRDSAQTTDENRKHWQATDSLSANAANDPTTRATIRDRCRHEYENNPYCAGLVDEISDSTVGTGPRLQLKIPGVDRQESRKLERTFSTWMEQLNLAERLRIGNASKIIDGEVFGLLFTNPSLDPFLPQLDVRLYEAAQVADPYLVAYDPRRTDGIVHDEYGNVSEYHLLKTHPGSEYAWGAQYFERIPAARMLHWFKPTRPGQSRGVSELSPALPLFAQLRRMTLAVLTAAEFAACISGVLESDQAPDYQGSDTENGDDPEFERVEIERGALLTTPKGYKAHGFDATEPFAASGEFKTQLLNEIGRAAQSPGVIVSGDYSQLNYSSGRLAKLPYHAAIRVRRNDCRSRVLNPVLRAWLYEAGLMGLLDGLPPIYVWAWEWQWDGFAAVDPDGETKARQTLLAAGLTTYAREFAEDGLDWEEQFEQQAIEAKRRKELGLVAAAPTTEPEPVETANEV